MKEFGLMFMAFFAIMNPLSNLPAYMALVADDNDRISHKIATKSLLIAFVVITFFVMTGHLIFNLFGITLSSLGDIKKQVMTILAFGLLCLLTYFILREAKRISSALGKSGMSIITKMMGLILTTIGIQMLVTGIQLTFHLS